MKNIFGYFVLLATLVLSISASLVQQSRKIAIMDERDRIVGFTTHIFSRDASLVVPDPPALQYPPMNTDAVVITALKSAFPKGSPNVTVSDPWVKKAETCSWNSDSNLIHHFEDTEFVPTNDICSLAPGLYTWIVTDDYQISIGKYVNTYEFTSKHANLAFMRTGFVAGELAVISATPQSKAMITWNLMSGTYSLPISEDQDKDKPMQYLENVLYPNMVKVFSNLPCTSMMMYGGENEFFPDALPTMDYVQQLCTTNYFIQYESALTWKSDGSSVCEKNNSAATCAVY